MPIEVSQLRPKGVDDAIAFAKTVSCELEPLDVSPTVSLIAKEDDAIVAAVLGVHDTSGACLLHVCLGKLEDPGKTTGDLLNKALMKVHGEGVRRCQIKHHGHDDVASDWPGAKWQGNDGTEAEAA